MKQLKSYDKLLNESFVRIQSGKLYDDKLKPYDESFIWEMIYFFQRKEEYEKCQTLKKSLENFDHEKNYKKWTPQSQRQMI
jgi:hypothetical protein